jgi:hypothetical protein
LPAKRSHCSPSRVAGAVDTFSKDVSATVLAESMDAANAGWVRLTNSLEACEAAIGEALRRIYGT